MKALKIKPDGVTSDPLGKVVCTYANGSCTIEHAMKTAYWTGVRIYHQKLQDEEIAIIGLSWPETAKRCSRNITLKRKNGETAVTVGGPLEDVRSLAQELRKDGIFVEDSTQYELDKYDEEHFEGNKTTDVLIDAINKIPKNAIILMFNQSNALNQVVNNVLGMKTKTCGLIKENHQDILLGFLESIGKLYTLGLNPVAKNMYEKVDYPVPRGTAMLNSLIKWHHEVSWHIKDVQWFLDLKSAVVIDVLRDDDYKYLLQHSIAGQNVFPAMGFVQIVWKVFCERLQIDWRRKPVVFNDVSFHRRVILPESGILTFQLDILEGTGDFKILESGNEVVSGTVRFSENGVVKFGDKELESSTRLHEQEAFLIDGEDFYKDMRLRGFEYGPDFQIVQGILSSGNQGRLSWKTKWVPFLEALLQITMFSSVKKQVPLATHITSIRIDPTQILAENQDVPFAFNPNISGCKAGAVEIQGVQWGVALQKCNDKELVFEEHVFVPFIRDITLKNDDVLMLRNYASVCSSVANRIVKQWKGVEGLSSKSHDNETKDVFEETFKFKGNNYSLLRCLLEIEKILQKDENCFDLKVLQERISPLLQDFEESLLEDPLNNFAGNENAMNDLLSIVYSNVWSKNCLVTEIRCNAQNKNEQVIAVNTMNITGKYYPKLKVALNTRSKPKLYCSLADVPKKNELLVAKNVFTDSGIAVQDELKSIANAVKTGGFILLAERTNVYPAEKILATLSGNQKCEQSAQKIEQAIETLGLCLIAKIDNGLSSVLYLLRKIQTEFKQETSNQVFLIPEQNDFHWIDTLKSKIKDCQLSKKKLWLLDSKPLSGCLGLYNCLKCEPGGQYLRLICNASLKEDRLFQQLTLDSKVIKDVFRKDLSINVYRDGLWGTFSYRTINNKPTPQLRDQVFLNTRGGLDGTQLEWTESPERTKTPVTVFYASINGIKNLHETEKLSSVADCDGVSTLEFSGLDDEGRRVMGVACCQYLTSEVTVPSAQLIEVPVTWILEEASSVPLVYLSAYYALIVKGRLKPRHSLLIHYDCTGLGYAATVIALSMECKVFVTVDSDNKIKTVQSMFPELNDTQINLSSNDQFQYQILNATKGKGVNVIMNTLNESGFNASIRCLSKHGHLVDVRYGTTAYEGVGMSMLQKNVTIHGALFNQLLENNGNAHKDLSTCMDLLREGLQKKTVRPVPYQVFLWNQAKEAYEFMEHGQCTGKVILELRKEEATKVPRKFLCMPGTYFKDTKSYIVLGDMRGIGLETVKWLVDKGAKNVILSSERTGQKGYEKLWLQRWTDQGVRVIISKHRASSLKSASSLIQEATDLGPVHGIFHVDMVFQNEWLVDMTHGRFQDVWDTTANSVQNLDKVTRRECLELQYFVVFSSSPSVTGMPGRSSYGFCCSAMERIVEQRRQQGFPGIALEFGTIGDVGPDFDNMGLNQTALKHTASQKYASCTAVLERFLQEEYTVVSSYLPLDKEVCSSGSMSHEESCKSLGNQEKTPRKQSTRCQGLGLTRKPKVAKQVLIPLNPEVSVSSGAKCLFFVHPLEGHVGMLAELGKLINFPAFGLQFTIQVPHTSIQDIAQYYVQQIKTVQPTGPYHLCALGFGSLIAFEMAHHLVKSDQVQTFICIEGSPESVKESSKQWLGAQKDTLSQAAAPYMMMVETCTPGITEEVELYLKHNIVNSCLEETLKVDKFKKLLGLHAPQNTVEDILFLNKRLAAAMACYESSDALQARAISVQFCHMTPQEEENSSSSEICDDFIKSVTGPVEVIRLNCSKTEALQEKVTALANVINSRLNI